MSHRNRRSAVLLALSLVFLLPRGVQADTVNPSADDSTPARCDRWWNATRDALSPTELHHDLDDLKAAVRHYTAQAAPRATALQARHYGLQMPAAFDPAKPLVVLVHGLDMETSAWTPIATLLRTDGQQVATFGYPGDGPIAEDTALLAQRLALLQNNWPQLKINLVAFSMGSLVARGYVEGPLYHGNVDHLILLAPPNHGSAWAKYQLLLKARHQYDEYESDPDWHPSWIVTEGLGEAGRDLMPDSDFLQQLNTLPRRAGVRYTIVTGNHHVLRRMGAEVLDCAMADLPDSWNRWNAVRTCRLAATVAAVTLRNTVGTSDGPVTLASAALPGVSDVVTLPADHETLYLPDGDAPPAAWPVLRNRLHR